MKPENIKKLPREGIDKILIRGTNWIGDAILTLPAVAAIRATYPQAHIAVLVKPWVADIYELFSAVDEVIIYENKFDNPIGVFRSPECSKGKNLMQLYFYKTLLKRQSSLFAAGIPLRAGYDSDGRGLLLTHRVKRTEEIRKVHQIDYYLEMVKALGCVSVDREMHLETKISLLDAQECFAEIYTRNKEDYNWHCPRSHLWSGEKMVSR